MKTEEYYELVFDSAAIMLLKLKKRNSAHLLISFYRNHLENNGLEELWSNRRSKVLLYQMNFIVAEECKDLQAINHCADEYMEFQVEYTKFLKLMLKASKKTANFWQ